MSTKDILESILKKRILFLDGAMGTKIQAYNLTAEDFGGEKFEGCNEYLSITRPEIIKEIHKEYLEAGSDIIETNSFGGTDVTLAEFGLQDKEYEINFNCAKLAKEVAKKYLSKKKPRFVAGSIGPTNRSISVTKSIKFEELEESYYKQAKALYEGGVDLFIIETVYDTLNAKACLNAIDRLFEEKPSIPLIISCTIEKNARMLAGQDVESFYISIEHKDLLAVGINCAIGPDLMRDHIRSLSNICKNNVLCYPNAGIPLEDGTYPSGPDEFAKQMNEFVKQGWVNIVGGCCGTTPDHIKEFVKQVNTSKIRKKSERQESRASGVESLFFEEDNRPILVGERTNVIGSKKFKELIVDEKFDFASEIASAQVSKGAAVIDICLANPDRDEKKDMLIFVDKVVKKVRVPFMIDSTDHEVIEESLKKCQGKSIINSINFEDGTDRIDKVMALAKKYGAMVIFGTIDEDKKQAMALTTKRKLDIAVRGAKYLKEKWDYDSENIIFDPLVFPVATGDKTYEKTAIETINAIKEIKEKIPAAKTVMGISNVSFGLPASGREVLNSIYLYHATKAGLDMAIVNSQKLIRYPKISSKEKKLAEDLLFFKTSDPITPFVDHFRGKKEVVEDILKLPLDERLPTYIIEGRKEGLIEDLDEALKKMKPLDIINGPLMKGMGVVGKLFNDNQLIVSEVLQSAEVMKEAVSYLETFMEKSETSIKGKIILGTVKGDVHDIGKNLMEIILSNNGYKIINLGIKVTPEVFIEEFKKHKPDIIGLSGLLVKSAQMMVITVGDFKKANINVPILVGGAALSSKFTHTKIAPEYDGIIAYSTDAMNGLSIVNQIIDDPDNFHQEITEDQFTPGEKKISTSTKRSEIEIIDCRGAPDLIDHLIEDTKLEEIFSYINEQNLYSIHLGLKGSYKKFMKYGEKKAVKLTNQVNEVKKIIIKNKLIQPRAIFKFFECNSDGNDLIIYNNNEEERFTFPRQASGEKICISDFVAPVDKGRDTIAFFVTTCGTGITQKATELRDKGEYLKSHILQVLAIESAEALAEIVHKKIRSEWGFPDTDLSLLDLFKTKYQGIRMSFGYPACPDMEDQKKLFKLLKPGKIGVSLTESDMMDPEASVSSIVFHHPQAKYFSV